MRIALDVTIQRTTEPTGVERAQATLVDALLEVRGEHELLLATPGGLPERWRGRPGVIPLEGGGGPSWWWRETFLPRALRAAGAALLHSPVAAIPLRARCPVLATIHEVPWRGEDEHLGDRRASHRLRLSLAARRAARLLCVSERTAADVCAQHPAARTRVVVLPHGVDPRWSPGAPGALPAGVPPQLPLVLAVGRLRRKKNLALLLDAFAPLCAGGAAGRPVLVLAGPDGDAGAELRARAARSDLAGCVVLPGFVDDETLLALYRRARCVVFPSRFEGFGLPVLEAFACGTPVIASLQGAAAEVAGEAALRVDGEDPTALGAALRTVLADRTLAARLSERGRAQAARFSAEQAARRALALYAEVAA